MMRRKGQSDSCGASSPRSYLLVEVLMEGAVSGQALMWIRLWAAADVERQLEAMRELSPP